MKTLSDSDSKDPWNLTELSVWVCNPIDLVLGDLDLFGRLQLLGGDLGLKGGEWSSCPSAFDELSLFGESFSYLQSKLEFREDDGVLSTNLLFL